MLHTLSITQVLDVWPLLEDAYHGTSHYGGDTAEIYLYHFLHGISYELKLLESPGLLGDMAREKYDTANQAMHDLFLIFAEKRDCRVEVEGKELGSWLKTARFCHRVHVKIVPKSKS